MSNRRHSVLVAESSRAIAEALRFHLLRAGLTVIVAHDGDQAAILAARQRFDLMIIDLDLPVISGKEFCRHLREDLQLTEIPLVVLTATEPGELVFKFDIARVFTKPIDPGIVAQFAKTAFVDELASV